MAQTKAINKLMGNQVFRFVLSAGAGFLVDVSAFYLFYHNLLKQKSYKILTITVHNSTVSLAMSFCMGVIVNFLITRYMVFNESKLAPQKQFIRFVSVAIIGFFANLAMVDLFVQVFNLYPPVARITAALSLFFASYFIHKVFSFSLSLRRHNANRQHSKPGN